ncbi:CIA30 family protein [Shewanella sp. DNRA4]|uniref:CIA30 family protein n=1 Tax=Shewanella sp. DNRA4 TaxID=2723055 RepID=UPI00146F303B|nr:CIA30 family protein [Shewanella sp. DNRA4]NMD52312.1 CIA30 family protein [Shewanella sp. DNRA4]
MILFDFKELNAAKSWYGVNDTVMGGLSRSKLAISPLGYGMFSGHVSLANGGGFASVRCEFEPKNVSEFTGIYLELDRDRSKHYKVNLKDADTPQSTVYQAPMPDAKHQSFGVNGGSIIHWQRIEIPFTAFHPQCRGKPIERVEIDLSRLTSIGLVIGAQQSGDFALKIKSIGCY